MRPSRQAQKNSKALVNALVNGDGVQSINDSFLLLDEQSVTAPCRDSLVRLADTSPHRTADNKCPELLDHWWVCI